MRLLEEKTDSVSKYQQKVLDIGFTLCYYVEVAKDSRFPME